MSSNGLQISGISIYLSDWSDKCLGNHHNLPTISLLTSLYSLSVEVSEAVIRIMERSDNIKAGLLSAVTAQASLDCLK